MPRRSLAAKIAPGDADRIAELEAELRQHEEIIKLLSAELFRRKEFDRLRAARYRARKAGRERRPKQRSMGRNGSGRRDSSSRSDRVPIAPT